MAEYLIQDTTLTEIADAIRGKTGGTDGLTLDEMATAISGINTGSIAKFTTGTLTLESDFVLGTTTSGFYTINHNLGEIPDIFYISCNIVSNTHINFAIFFNVDQDAKTGNYFMSIQGEGSYLGNLSGYHFDVQGVLTENEAKLIGHNDLSGARISANYEYKWVAIKYKT